MIKIDFEFTTRYGVFRDALYFPEDAIPPEEEIEAMKQQRLNNWIAIMEQPPQDVAPLPLPPEEAQEPTQPKE